MTGPSRPQRAHHDAPGAGVRATATATDGKHYVDLKVLKYGTVDDYGTVWAPGVFTDSLRRRLPVLAVGHDWGQPVGRATRLLGDDGTGPVLRFRFDDFDDVPQARRAWSQARSGTYTDCSVGFTRREFRAPTDAELQRWPGAKEVMVRADLDEVSLVLVGAVPGAEVVGVRAGGSDGQRAQQRSDVARALQEADEVLEELGVPPRSRGYRSAPGQPVGPGAGQRRQVPLDDVVALGRSVAKGRLTEAQALAELDRLHSGGGR